MVKLRVLWERNQICHQVSATLAPFTQTLCRAVLLCAALPYLPQQCESVSTSTSSTRALEMEMEMEMEMEVEKKNATEVRG